MAKVEIPELTQALAVLTNETATVIAELKDLVQVVAFAIENATVTITRSVDVVRGSIGNINLITSSALNVTNSVNGTVQTTNDMLFYVMACLCFTLVSIGIFFLAAAFARIFCALRSGHKQLAPKANVERNSSFRRGSYKSIPNEFSSHMESFT